MILDIISICLLVSLLITVLLLYIQMLTRFNAMKKIQQRIFKRFDSLLEKVQIQSYHQVEQVEIDKPDEDLNISDENWKEQFADRFVHYLETHRSRLMDPAVFMGKNASGYPDYIGFSIRRIKNLNIYNDPDAFWLAASTVHDGKIYLKLQMNNLKYFNELKSQKAAIEIEFGNQLKWEDENKPHRIGIDLSVNPLNKNEGEWEQHFEDMCKILERLDKIFYSHIEGFFPKDSFI